MEVVKDRVELHCEQCHLPLIDLGNGWKGCHGGRRGVPEHEEFLFLVASLPDIIEGNWTMELNITWAGY